jgi:NAD dependent epimerase/dehydratase family enzyme
MGGAIGPGDQWLSPISLRDEVRAVLWLLDNHHSGPFNLVAPCALTNRSFSKALGHQLHRPSKLHVPAAAVRVAFGPELADATVLASQRVVPSALLASGFNFESPDIASILAASLS